MNSTFVSPANVQIDCNYSFLMEFGSGGKEIHVRSSILVHPLNA